ncbi:MAG: Eco57I restriction-modification methylase domain-containing protein, partial [Polyangiales bacterium]
MTARSKDGLGAHETPAHVVRFVVGRTLGPILEERAPDDERPLRVLDPSCGSGVFLQGAYRHLARWYRRRWLERLDEALETDRMEHGPRGSYRLTARERARIVRSHLFGVDLDAGAVARTRAQLARLGGRSRAEALEHNVVYGNAAIGTDWETRTDERLRARDRHATVPFDWHEAFPDATGYGGFDVIVGNPPYLDSERMSRELPSWRQYCAARYEAASGNWDMFCVFVELALELCREGGLHAFVVPNKLASAAYAADARRVLAERSQLIRVRDYSEVPLFEAHVYPLVYVARRTRPDTRAQVRWERMEASPRGARVTRARRWPLRRIMPEPRHPWVLPPGPEHVELVDRLGSKFAKLGDVAEVRGAATVAEAYELPELLTERRIPQPSDLRVINSGTVDRYEHQWGRRSMRYLKKGWLHPVVDERAQQSLPDARRRQARSPKIVVAGLTRRPECCADLDGSLLAAKSTSVVRSDLDLRFLLALLNSRLVGYWLQARHGGESLRGGYMRIGPPQLTTVPVAPAGGSRTTAQLLELVDRMHVLLAKRASPCAPEARDAIQDDIAQTDEAIDELVFELYGLSERERALV